MSNSYSKSSQVLAEFINIEETQLQFEEAFNRNFPIEPVYINQKCDEELYNSLFYIKKDVSCQTKTTTIEKGRNENVISVNRPVFFVKKEPKKLNGKTTFLGRKKKSETSEINQNSSIKANKIHDKNELYNSLNKIQVNCFNSIPGCVNSFLDFLNHDKNERFLLINASFKKKVNKTSIDERKRMKLYEIICLEHSPKYKKYPLDYNKTLYDKLKKRAETEKLYQVLINFLQEDYLYYFQNVYFKNKRTINLHKYGIDAILTLSEEVKMFNDKFESFKDKESDYLDNIKKCINLCFFDGKLMLFQLENKND